MNFILFGILYKPEVSMTIGIFCPLANWKTISSRCLTPSGDICKGLCLYSVNSMQIVVA